jgi:hypothetical protein
MGDNCSSSGNYLVFLQAGNQVGFPINKGDNFNVIRAKCKGVLRRKGNTQIRTYK